MPTTPIFVKFSGEYVSLYHQQRYLMKQRTAEKDCHISRLSSERTELQSKFRQLQTLLVQLLRERNSLPEDAALFAAVNSNDLELVGGETNGKRKEVPGEEEGRRLLLIFLRPLFSFFYFNYYIFIIFGLFQQQKYFIVF